MVKNEFKTYDEMNKPELWAEIEILVNCGHYSGTDKELFLNLIKEWGLRHG